MSSFTLELWVVMLRNHLTGILQLRAQNVPTPKRYQSLLTSYYLKETRDNTNIISKTGQMLCQRQDKYYLKDRTNAANVSIRHTREKMKSDTQYF